MHSAFAIPALALTIGFQPLPSEDVLEPSIVNEVDHALSLVPAEAYAAATNALAATAGGATAPGKEIGLPPAMAFEQEVKKAFDAESLSATELAIKLVSSQGGDGRWIKGTNDWTVAAVSVLLGLR